MIRSWLVAGAMALALNLHAQDRYTPTAPLPLGSHLLSLPTSQMPSDGTWETWFMHRFNQSIDEGSFADQVHSLFGLDTNANVVFGLSKVLRRDLQVSIARSNVNDTLEIAGKYVVLRQAQAVPASVTVRGGVDWRTERDMDDRTSFFAQAIVSRQFGRRAEISILPTFVTDAGRAVAGDTSVAMFEHAFNVPIGVAVMVRPSLAVVAEIVPPNQELDEADLGWALGIKRAIGGHWFEILLTNNNGTFADQLMSSTFQGTPFDAGEMHLGFNIESRFGGR